MSWSNSYRYGWRPNKRCYYPNQELQYTNVYQEGGDYVTKDISKVLKTSKKIAEGLKLNYGEAYPQLASKETFQVEVIGEVEPVEVTEEYLAQIISAR